MRTRQQSTVTKTYLQFSNLVFASGSDWNDELSYSANLRAAIKNLEAHNKVILSGDALRAANNPEIFGILPSNRGTLLWMYNRALDASQLLKAQIAIETDSLRPSTLCSCGETHEQKAKESTTQRDLLREELADQKKMTAALECVLTFRELTIVRKFRDAQPFQSSDAYLIGGVGLLLGYIPMFLTYYKKFDGLFFIGLLFSLLGFVLMTIVGKSIVAKVIEIRDQRLARHISQFATADDAEYLDWDVPGLRWNETLSDTENREVIVKAIEAHNQVVLACAALAAVQQQAKFYYSSKPVKKVPRKVMAYDKTRTRKGYAGTITIVSHAL